MLLGGAGNDVLVGGADIDVLIAGTGADTLFGDGGRDVFAVGTMDMDVIADFVSGTDRVNLSAFSITSFTQFETDFLATQRSNGWTYTLKSDPAVGFDLISTTKLTASDFIFGEIQIGLPIATNDTLTGGGLDDLLMGLGGNDSLNGGAGPDTLLGGVGADTLDGDSGADVFWFGPGESRAVAGAQTTIMNIDVPGGDRVRLAANAVTGLTLTSTTVFTIEATDGFSDTLADVLFRLGSTTASTSSAVVVGTVHVTSGILSGNRYALINDGTGGAQSTDLLIRLVGTNITSGTAFTVGDFV